jgi:beta-glucosidase
LSYTRFKYGDAKLEGTNFSAGDTIKLAFTLQNTGKRAGDEVAQVYFRHVKSALPQAKLALCGFMRISLAQGQAARVTVDIPAQRFRYWDPAKKQYVVEPGGYELLLGAASDDIRLRLPLNITRPQ